jgi:hypothetical protein
MFCRKSLVCVLAVVMALAAASVVNAALIGTAVDATLDNTGPASAIISPESDTDHHWTLDTSRTGPLGNTVFVSQSSAENSPVLTTTVTGLSQGTYDVYLLYSAKEDLGASWSVSAALSGGTLVNYDVDDGTASGYDFDNAYGTVFGRQVLLGRVTGTSFAVDVDDVSLRRSWHDGVAYNAVPEPGTIVLLATGLLGLLAYAWRKRR